MIKKESKRNAYFFLQNTLVYNTRTFAFGHLFVDPFGGGGGGIRE